MAKSSARDDAKGASARSSKKQSAKQINRQAEVTQAAIEIFWQKGYQAASIQDVADKVGVLKGSLYYYIDSKEDLLWRVIEDVHGEWTEILHRAGDLDVGPIVQIHAFIKLHVEWYLTNVKEVSVFFREWHHLGGERLKVIRERRRQYEQVIRDMIGAACEDGEVSAELNQVFASRYVLAAVNAVPDWYRPTSGAPPAEVAEAYADMTVGLLTGTPMASQRSLRNMA